MPLVGHGGKAHGRERRSLPVSPDEADAVIDGNSRLNVCREKRTLLRSFRLKSESLPRAAVPVELTVLGQRDVPMPGEVATLSGN